MKSPNLRLSETQAFIALILGLLSVLSLPVIAFLVFRNLDWGNKVILYNPQLGLGQYRGPLIYLGSAITSAMCIAAGFLGFNSLGHKRNSRQMYSWLGMLLGAVCFALVLIMFSAWWRLSEPLIQKM